MTSKKIEDEVAKQVARKKVTVDTVEEPIELSEETIEHLAEVSHPQPSASEKREIALTSEGQRSVNLIWEHTQRIVALSVTWAALFVASYLAILGGNDAQVAAFVFLFGVANLVIGFYFGRTNHQKIGGIIQGR